MARDVVDAEIIESRDELVAWLEAGCKPAGAFRVGTEHEKIPFYHAGLSPVPYEGETRHPRAARGHECAARLGAHRGRRPSDRPLSTPSGGGAISLEPGGQFELSGAPLATVHETAERTRRAPRHAGRSRGPLGIGFLALGMSPKWTLAETPVMPKSRYGIMARYMPKVGTRGLDMMFRTATVQSQSRFSRRSGHGRQDARRARAAAGDHRALRQFALHRRQARTAFSRRARRSGATPMRRAPACCLSPSSPAWASSATSITRSTCRCISSSAASIYHRRRRRELSRSARRPARRAAGRARDDVRLGEPPVDDLSRRCGSSAISRCAAPTSVRRTASWRWRR